MNKEFKDKFQKKLWEYAFGRGYGAVPKGDLYEFLIYLYNKCGDNKGFFDLKSNADNARYLKTTESKIKIAKKNIAMKFMDDEEYAEIFNNFISDIKSEQASKYKMLINGNSAQIELLIENPALRQVLETKLKKATNNTFEYSLNSELVKIGIIEFICMLNIEGNLNVSKSNLEKIYALKNNKQELLQKAGEILGFSAMEFIKGASNAAGGLAVQGLANLILC